MSHALFNVTQVTVGTSLRRGARVTCGYCDKSHSIAVNQMHGSGGDDDDIVAQHIADKFKNLGWLIGKREIDHRCPECFAAIRASNARKTKEKEMASNKVVSINPPETLPVMGKADKRIIIEKLRDVYIDETVGYKDDWTDEKVAKDLGTHRGWVSMMREDIYGPEINENSVKQFDEARKWLEDVAKLRDIIEPLFPEWHRLLARGGSLEQSLRKFCENK